MRYVFGDYSLDPAQYELRRAGQRVPIEPRVVDVLAYLVQHAGQTVTLEALLAHLYPDQFVPVERVTNAVAQARKALGETSQHPRYIQTVRRRGYCFLAPVEVRQTATPDTRDLPLPQSPSVAEPLHRAPAEAAGAPTHPPDDPPAAPPPRRAPLGDTPMALVEHLRTSRTALEGERKQITVLFADLTDSLALIRDLDAEAAQQLLDPALHAMMHAVHRYEGTVNQVLGDGIMALFGAPIAYEDHAVRACYAALALQTALRAYAEDVHRTHGLILQSRIGLNSGDVVVRAIHNDLHMALQAQ